MVSIEPRRPDPVRPERLIVLEAAEYAKLLVSRRRLERVLDRSDQLHDRDTHEVFVVDPRSAARMAKGA